MRLFCFGAFLFGAFVLGFCFWLLCFFGFWLLLGEGILGEGKRITEGKINAEGELLKGNC
jgi:hypothetical protein